MISFKLFLGILAATTLLAVSSFGVAMADKGQGRSPPDSNVAECGARTSNAVPPQSVEGDGGADSEDGAFCPDGQVPHPKAKHAHKGKPRRDGDGAKDAKDRTSIIPAFSMAAVPGPGRTSIVNAQGIPTGGIGAGLVGTLSQHKPFLAAKDYHSLAEIIAISPDGQQIVEVGWTVDRGVNGDDVSRLFVYHWVDGQATCYNGCGWVQISPTHYPGMRVKTGGEARKYKLAEREGNWWVSYAGHWIGFFPEAQWPTRFIEMGYGQWSGEVAAVADGSCSNMGNGKYGTDAGAASFTDMKFMIRPDLGGEYVAERTIVPVGETLRRASAPNLYDFKGKRSSTSTTLRYGGPGAC